MYLISACLCGVNCKYNGSNNYNAECDKLFTARKAVLVCPEQLGGLPTPRIPSELQDSAESVLKSNGKIITKDGRDVTEEFIKGANEVVKITQKLNVKIAILKDGSPSCGVNFIYDGTFSNNKIPGMGVTTKLLQDAGIKVFSEKDFGGK